MRHLLFLTFTVLASVLVCAQAVPPLRLTIREAEEQALKNHPQISAAEYNSRAADQIPVEINAARFPTILASLTGTEATETTRITAGGLNNPSIFPRLGAGLAVSQLVTDFGRTSGLVDSFKTKADAIREGVASARALVLLRVDRAFLQCLRTQALLKVAEQTVKSRGDVAEQAEALQKSGLKSGLDVSIANYALAEATLLRTRLENDVRSSFAELSEAMGAANEQTFQLAEDGLAPMALPILDTALKEALDHRPELKTLRLERQSAYQFLRAEKLLNKPTVTAVWAIGVTPFHDNRLSNGYNAAGFNLSIPIFNGRLFKARANEAEFRARSYDERVIEAGNVVSREVRQAWLSADSSFRNIALAAQLLARAKEGYDLASERYRMGLSSIVELSQAQLNLTAAEIENANARYEFLIRQAVLDFMRGLTR